MQSQADLIKTGLTFSLNDANFDTNGLNLVPILLNQPEKEVEIKNEEFLEKNATKVKNTIDFTSLRNYAYNQFNSNQEANKCDINYSTEVNNLNKFVPQENLVKEPEFLENDVINQYEPVSYYWFYCIVRNGLAEWKPFSIKDSSRIESRFIQFMKGQACQEQVDDSLPTDGGRYDVLINKRQKISIYWEEAPMEIRRASWFYRPEDESYYLPFSEWECDRLEEKFKWVMENNLWHQPFELVDSVKSLDERCLEDKFVFHSAHTMVEYRRYSGGGYLPASLGGPDDEVTKGRVVYRGVDGFQAHLDQGESDEIDHVMFVIHGIGPVCDMGGRGIVDCVSAMRNIASTMLSTHFPRHRGRVELLPVSWHGKFHTGPTSVDRDLSRITLRSVPKLRSFTNNTLVDVLSYSSPAYCQTILAIVAAEMNRLRHLFVSRNPQYDGPISLAGHSLGSMIAFDLVSLQHDSSRGRSLVPIADPDAVPSLQFDVGHLFALGSPISLLLTARGHPALGDDFQLPACRGFFNIFHPFDPVAYRIEPMLVYHNRHGYGHISGGQEARPVVVPHHKGRKRLHLEFKDNLVRVSHDIKTRLFQTLKSTWSSLQEFATAHKSNLADELGDDEDEIMRVLDKIDDGTAGTVTDRDDLDASGGGCEVHVGQLNGGRRVDYVLQEAPLESFNDYLFALGSHACYWDSEDTVLMMLKEIYSTLNISPELRSIDVSSISLASQSSPDIRKMANVTQLPPPLMPMMPSRPSTISTALPTTFQNVQKKPFFMPNAGQEELDKARINAGIIGLDKSPRTVDSDKNKSMDHKIEQLPNLPPRMTYDSPPDKNLCLLAQSYTFKPRGLVSSASDSLITSSNNKLNVNYDTTTFYQPEECVETDNFLESEPMSKDVSRDASVTLFNKSPSPVRFDELCKPLHRHSSISQINPTVGNVQSSLLQPILLLDDEDCGSSQTAPVTSNSALMKSCDFEIFLDDTHEKSFHTSAPFCHPHSVHTSQSPAILQEMQYPPPIMLNQSNTIQSGKSTLQDQSIMNFYSRKLPDQVNPLSSQASIMTSVLPPTMLQNKLVNEFHPDFSSDQDHLSNETDTLTTDLQYPLATIWGRGGTQPVPASQSIGVSHQGISSDQVDPFKSVSSSQPNELPPMNIQYPPPILPNKLVNIFQPKIDSPSYFCPAVPQQNIKQPLHSNEIDLSNNSISSQWLQTANEFIKPSPTLQHQKLDIFSPTLSSFETKPSNDSYYSISSPEHQIVPTDLPPINMFQPRMESSSNLYNAHPEQQTRHPSMTMQYPAPPSMPQNESSTNQIPTIIDSTNNFCPQETLTNDQRKHSPMTLQYQGPQSMAQNESIGIPSWNTAAPRVDSSNNFYCGLTEERSKPPPIAIQYPAPPLMQQNMQWEKMIANSSDMPPINMFQPRIDSPTNIHSTQPPEQIKSSPMTAQYQQPVSQSQLSNMFHPYINFDSNLSSDSDGFFESCGVSQGDSQYANGAMCNVTLSSSKPLEIRKESQTPIFSQSTMPDLDSPFIAHQQLQPTASFNKHPQSFEPKPSWKFYNEPAAYSCRTPSPKVSHQNLRNSPKTIPMAPSVFTSKPLVPQSGKLFKKK